MSAYTLSSFPTFAQPVTLLVGVANADDGTLRVYLGARYRGRHLIVTDPADQEAFRRVWATGGHVWLWPIPPADLIHTDREEHTP